MHLATCVRTWRVARLYSVRCTVQLNISISEPVWNRINVHIHFFAWNDQYYDLQKIDLSSWDTLLYFIKNYNLEKQKI
jgi:hypothetical protein